MNPMSPMGGPLSPRQEQRLGAELPDEIVSPAGSLLKRSRPGNGRSTRYLSIDEIGRAAQHPARDR